MEPRLKWNKIILALIFIRQLFQPIAASVYCNRQAAAGRRSRCKAEISTRQQAPAQLNGLWSLNSAHRWRSAEIILFYFMMEPRMK